MRSQYKNQTKTTENDQDSGELTELKKTSSS